MRGQAVKANLAFDFMLYHKITSEYKYYHSSSNTMEFNWAFTISQINNIDAFLKRLMDLDLSNTYYMKRPDISWVFVGLPNFKLFF